MRVGNNVWGTGEDVGCLEWGITCFGQEGILFPPLAKDSQPPDDIF